MRYLWNVCLHKSETHKLLHDLVGLCHYPYCRNMHTIGVSFTPLVFLCSKQRASISLRPILRPRTISCDCTPRRVTMLVGVPSHPFSQQRSATNVKWGCCTSHKLHRPVHAPSEPYLVRCSQSCVKMIDHRPGLTVYISFAYSFLSFERSW